MIVTAQSFPNSDGMRAQLESHLSDINRTADVAYDSGNSGEAIDLIVVTDSEAILGIGGEQTFESDCPPDRLTLIRSDCLCRPGCWRHHDIHVQIGIVHPWRRH